VYIAGAIYLGYAVMHEAVDHLLTPRIVSTISSRILHFRALHAKIIYHLSLFLVLFNSLWSPMIGALLFRTECYYYILFPLKTESLLAPPNFFTLNATMYSIHYTYNISTPIRESFEVDSSCVSSLISTYAPAYIFTMIVGTFGKPLIHICALIWKRSRRSTPHHPDRKSLNKGSSSSSSSSISSVKDIYKARVDYMLESIYLVNTICICITIGFLTPAVAIVGALCLAIEMWTEHMVSSLHELPSSVRESISSLPMNFTHFTLPISCVFQMLLFHSAYLVCLFFLGEYPSRYVLVGVLALLWLILGVLARVLYHRDKFRHWSSSSQVAHDHEESEGLLGGDLYHRELSDSVFEGPDDEI
jgi:hypothetical protein